MVCAMRLLRSQQRGRAPRSTQRAYGEDSGSTPGTNTSRADSLEHAPTFGPRERHDNDADQTRNRHPAFRCDFFLYFPPATIELVFVAFLFRFVITRAQKTNPLLRSGRCGDEAVTQIFESLNRAKPARSVKHLFISNACTYQLLYIQNTNVSIALANGFHVDCDVSGRVERQDESFKMCGSENGDGSAALSGELFSESHSNVIYKHFPN